MRNILLLCCIPIQNSEKQLLLFPYLEVLPKHESMREKLSKRKNKEKQLQWVTGYSHHQAQCLLVGDVPTSALLICWPENLACGGMRNYLVHHRILDLGFLPLEGISTLMLTTKKCLLTSQSQMCSGCMVLGRGAGKEKAERERLEYKIYLQFIIALIIIQSIEWTYMLLLRCNAPK